MGLAALVGAAKIAEPMGSVGRSARPQIPAAEELLSGPCRASIRPMSTVSISWIALVVAGFSIGCKSETTCRSYSGTGQALATFFTASDCSDQNTYAISCGRKDIAEEFSCTCTKQGVAGKTFSRREPIPGIVPDTEPALQIANGACGWNLRR
jgi:hypothetical protein